MKNIMKTEPICVKWDEKVMELYKIVSADDAEQIIREVKAEANPYPVQVAVERMETIIQILLKGMPAYALLPYIKNYCEQRVLRAREFECCDKLAGWCSD